MDLFDHARQEQIAREAPLAARMRPRTLDEFAGQEHIVGPGRLLRRAIQADQLSSLIFYGPPGTGKTTLARIIANTTQAHFIAINAVLAGVKDIREAIDVAQERRKLYGQRTILFVDEVHRFNKAQQDALLPHVENGTIILVGATTENPYFEVIKSLVSRSRIFELRRLTEDDLRRVAQRALDDPERGYGRLKVHVADEVLDHLVNVANGDARAVLNALELAVETTPPDAEGVIHVDLAVAEESIQRRAVLYDKDGDAHFDTISAFIKSLRGSDPDAALYWMARMLYAGEDPRFIFRRMLIFAGEDVGMADPNAMRVVTACAQAFDYVGMPEGRFHLSQACILSGDGAQKQHHPGALRRHRGGGAGARGGGPGSPQGRQPGRPRPGARPGLSVSSRLSRPLGSPAIPARESARACVLPADGAGLRGPHQGTGSPAARGATGGHAGRRTLAAGGARRPGAGAARTRATRPEPLGAAYVEQRGRPTGRLAPAGDGRRRDRTG
jgi:putative ATPase